MNALLRDKEGGLLKTLVISFVLHALFISVGAVTLRSAGKTFLSPVYTVTLVDPSSIRPPSPGTPQEMREKREEAKKAVKEGVKKAGPEPATREKEATAAKPAVKTSSKALIDKKENRSPVSEAIKRISEKVTKKEESELLEKRIEEIRRKEAHGSKEIKGRLEGIRSELSGRGGRGGRGEGGEKDRTANAEGLSTLRPSTSGKGGGGGAGGAGRAGGAGDLSIKYRIYLSTIRDMVQEKWIFPEELEKESFSVIVSIKISRNGRLMDYWLEKSSGSPSFDEFLINAVRKAAPFPPLPEDFRGDHMETGFRFCRGCSD